METDQEEKKGLLMKKKVFEILFILVILAVALIFIKVVF